MARKAHNIHYIYKTTCNVTGKYYVGMHSTSNLDDGYLGSGKRLRYSIRKHGVDNHTKEILEYLPTREALVLREIEIITKELVEEPMCMNLMCGGQGGFISEEQQKHRSICAGNALAKKLKEDSEFREKHRQQVSKNMVKAHKGGKIKYDNFKDKNHSDKSKKLMSDSKKGTGTGETNSQYGTCWIMKDDINKKVKKEDLDTWVNEGWVKGRK